MSRVSGVKRAILQSLLKFLLFLVMPVTIIFYEWSGFAGAMNFFYGSRIFSFVSITLVGEILPHQIPEFHFIFDGLTAAAIVVAIPGLYFNYRVLRASKGQSLLRPLAGTILATVLLDVTVPSFLMSNTFVDPTRSYYFYLSTNTPWIFIVFIFFPMILHQATLLDIETRCLQNQKKQIFPTSNWMLVFLLGCVVALASPASVTYSYYGLGETLHSAGLVTPVGLWSGTWDFLLENLLIEFSYYGGSYPLNLYFLLIFTLEYYFVFETTRFLRGRAPKMRTCGLALLSWMTAYLGLLIIFVLTSNPEMSIQYELFPLPIVPLVGIAVLIRKQPILLQNEEIRKEDEDDAAEYEITPEAYEGASEVIVPYYYILLSKMREFKLNVFERES